MGCGFESHRAHVSDAFLYAGVRTPFGRYAGGLAGTRPDDLAATVSTTSCSGAQTAPVRTTATWAAWPGSWPACR
jgi:hypothetical protein